jgi:hypothetical protein
MSTTKKIKVLALLDNTTLESSGALTQPYANRVFLQSYESDQLNLSVKYTTGAGEVLTNAYIKVFGYTKYDDKNSVYDLPDQDGWIQIGGYVLGGGGVATFVPFTFKVAGGIAAHLYENHFAQGITFTKIMIEAYETGVVANKGTIEVDALIQ